MQCRPFSYHVGKCIIPRSLFYFFIVSKMLLITVQPWNILLSSGWSRAGDDQAMIYDFVLIILYPTGELNISSLYAICIH